MFVLPKESLLIERFRYHGPLHILACWEGGAQVVAGHVELLGSIEFLERGWPGDHGNFIVLF